MKYLILNARNHRRFIGQACELLDPAQPVPGFAVPQCRIGIDGEWFYAPREWLMPLDPATPRAKSRAVAA